MILETFTEAPPLRNANREYARFTTALNEQTFDILKEPLAVRSVRGVVTSGDGNQAPLIEVIVEIKGPGSRQKVRRGKTDHRGRFRIKNSPRGTYKLRATLDGFQSLVGTIIVSTNDSNTGKVKRTKLELQLKPDGTTKREI